IILIECKHWKQELSLHDNQLLRYFHVSKAKFGVLTNGIIYKFYTDLVEQNKMDEKPFLEIDLENLKEASIEELKKFHKSYFDVDYILTCAAELKFTSELMAQLVKEFNSPSPEFVKLFAKRVYEGMITPKLLDQFTTLVKKSIANHINNTISDRLNIALKNDNEGVKQDQTAQPIDQVDIQNAEPKIVTSDIEKEGFFIIKSILRKNVDPERITCRDSQTYFAVLIDNNNRKPICRLYFNNPENKQFALLDENKKEIKYKIQSIDELYIYSDALIKAIEKYT
ncbi:restriction endonuclease, partial [bacterium]|nr:restriction endonuclease [bacterium]